MNYTIYNGIVTYNTLLPGDALDFALFNNDLDGIKYISDRYGLNYIDEVYRPYKKYSNWKSASLSKATKLRDLKGIKAFYAEMGYSSESLYDSYYKLESKKEAAAEFRDLEGLYCMWLTKNFFCILQEQNNYSTFEKTPTISLSSNSSCNLTDATFLAQFDAFPDTNEIKSTCNRIFNKSFQAWLYNTEMLCDDDLLFAVAFNDADVIDLMQKKLNNNPDNINLSKNQLIASLRTAYHKRNLELAEKLINLGAPFYPHFMFRPNGRLERKKYENHIDSINVEPTKKNMSLSIVDAMFLKPLLHSELYSRKCFVVDSVANYSYTTDNNAKLLMRTLINLVNNDYIVSGILAYFSLLNHPETQHTPMRIFVLDGMLTHFRRDTIGHPYSDYFIHSQVDSKNLDGFLAHESSHALLYILFNNIGKPFFSTDETSKTYRYVKYKDAEFNTIAKVYSFIGETPEEDCTWRNRDCYKELIKSLAFDLVPLALAKWGAEVKDFPLYNHHNLFQRDTKILAKNYYIYIKKKGRTDFGKYLTHEERVEFLKDAIKRKGWSEDQIVLLSRFHECISRKTHNLEDNIETELIVRLPELLASGNTAVSELFSPLKQYWEEFISPEIENSIKLFNIDECNSISCIDECRSEIEKTHYTQPQEDPKPYWSPYYDFMFSMLEYLTVDECGLSNPQNHNRLESGEIPKSSWSLPSITDFFSYFTTSNSDTAGEVKEDEEV